MSADHPSGVGPLLSRVEWGADVQLGPVVTVLGPATHVGTGRALPSSAAELRGDVGPKRQTVAVWVAAPQTPPDPAPVYLHAGKAVVLPVVRLFVDDAAGPEYLSQRHWLDDAVTRWRFAAADGPPATVLQRMADLPPDAGLDLLALVVRYALFGAAYPVRAHGLTLPPMPMWVRPAGDGHFAQRASRSMVVTARLDLAKADAPAVPRLTRAGAHRILPGDPRDRGLDPFHTPEGSEIRLVGRLGVGVRVAPQRTLAVRPGLALGPSSARLPFAGFNDPRRLLMAANMQAQAIPVAGREKPAVTAAGDGPDPPGVNLRVGYLAWGGWNHEDAWVLSESAAAKLATTEESTITLERRALEVDEPLLVKPGQYVRGGELLIARRYAPALLTDDLATLAALPDLDETVPVPPEIGDRAPDSGEVVAVENVDLLADDGKVAGCEVADGLTARYRRVYRVTLRRELPLRVGDKLANRHGHKGVVGLILPDEQMPVWRGEPLEALIDPVSVLNRSNWGQLRESVEAGADAERDEAGRSAVALPGGRVVRAVAGVQFVMRLPQHSADKLTAAGAGGGGRAQRFGEMDRWAAWGHGLLTGPTPERSPAAERLGHLLAGAGYRFERGKDAITLARWPLDQKPPAHFEPIPVPIPKPPEMQTQKKKQQEQYEPLAEQYAILDAPGGPRALVFDPPVELPARGDDAATTVCWLPLVPASARPPLRLADGSEEAHPLTQSLHRLVRALRRRGDDEKEVQYALRRLMDEACVEAVGRSATGTDSSKGAWLRRGVLGRRVVPSGRAVVTPAGELGLGLDEIGLPPALADALFGTEQVNGRTVWLKRDPVLHRWGLLAVRVRVVPGATIRLPASLLGPLGADFDGDTVAVFAALPDGTAPPAAARPSALAWDGRAMFVPGKQYLYGLHLLRDQPKLRAALNDELRAANGPEWPTGTGARQELEEWVRLAGTHPTPDGGWWAVVERHALAALADDPGMGLRLLGLEAIRELPAVACGAVKNLYGPGPAEQRMAGLLRGDGFQPYAEAAGGLDAVADPIAGVMVAAKTAVGRFGGALRRLLYSLPTLTPELVRAAQTLTEQITQKALSVKAGDPPVSVGEYESHLRRLLAGEGPPADTTTPLGALLNQPRLRAVWERLQRELGGDVPAWLRWLRNPHELRELLATTDALTIPPGDPRAVPLVTGPAASGAK